MADDATGLTSSIKESDVTYEQLAQIEEELSDVETEIRK
jgi:hypothetical protein